MRALPSPRTPRFGSAPRSSNKRTISIPSLVRRNDERDTVAVDTEIWIGRAIEQQAHGVQAAAASRADERAAVAREGGIDVSASSDQNRS